MNERKQDLEAELLLMRPREPSKDLVSRIAESVDGAEASSSPTRLSRHRWQVSLATAAGLLLTASCWFMTGADERTNQHSSGAAAANMTEQHHASPVKLSKSPDRDLPTRGSFHVAIRSSMSDFDALLDHHGSRPMPSTRAVSIRQLLEANSS